MLDSYRQRPIGWLRLVGVRPKHLYGGRFGLIKRRNKAYLMHPMNHGPIALADGRGASPAASVVRGENTRPFSRVTLRSRRAEVHERGGDDMRVGFFGKVARTNEAGQAAE